MVKPSIFTFVTPVATAMQRMAPGPMPHGEAFVATLVSFAPTMCVTAAPSRERSVRFFRMYTRFDDTTELAVNVSPPSS